jgi:hypothetical protein
VGSNPQKKAGVIEHLQAFDHAGLLFNEPPGQAGLPFIQSSDGVYSSIFPSRLQVDMGSSSALIVTRGIKIASEFLSDYLYVAVSMARKQMMPDV